MVEVIRFLIDLISLACFYIIISLSLNLEYGWAGIPNFGKMLFVGAGAYVVAYFAGRIMIFLFSIKYDYINNNAPSVAVMNQILISRPVLGISIFITVLALALLIGVLFGLFASIISLRLREDYFAMSLYIFAEIERNFVYNYDRIAGGNLGVAIPDPFLWLYNYIDRYIFFLILLISFSVITFLIIERMTKSPLGRTLKAIRENEVVAQVYGKNIFLIKTKVFMIASMFASLAGALYAFYAGGVIAVAYDRVSWTFWPFFMIILGGLANNLGATVGAISIVSVRYLIDFYKFEIAHYVPFDVAWLEYILVGIALILILIFRQEGLIKEKPVKTLAEKEIQAIIVKEKRE